VARRTAVDRGLCRYCHQNPIVGRRRKYCPDHARNASAILKREYRRDWKARGDKYWLSDWKSDEERKAYFRTYMREYRRRRRSRRAA
jgi:hypothetical protein